ncbi:MAG: carbohydrate kinase [Tannerella sp.]|jgi:fructokinase|nr:carbohydrate kinase [Tannerella sp.]
MKRPVIVGIGELLWDVFPDRKRAGGAPVNFVYHASQLGAEGYAISAVGNDVFGSEILQELKRNHIGHLIETVDHPTGSVRVELANGIPSYTITEKVAWDYIPLTQASIELVRRADALCFGTLAQRSAVSRETIATLLGYAPADALRFFDVNIREKYYSKELIASCLEKADIFKANDEELALLSEMFGQRGKQEDVCRWFLQTYGLRYFILTAGSEYSAVYGIEGTSVIPTPSVRVADTVGAGDAFSGAFTYAILTGTPLAEAHAKAVDIAAFVCTRDGAWPEYDQPHKTREQ